MTGVTSNSALLQAVKPPASKSTAAAWEKPLVAIVNGSAGMTRSLMAPIIRATDPLPMVTPPVPMAVRPKKEDSVWDSVKKALGRSTTQNEQIVRERTPSTPIAVAPVKVRSPFVQAVNKVARQTSTTASSVQSRSSPHLTATTKPLAAAMENAPQLLLSGPTAKMKAANLVTGAAIDYGLNQTTAGAASKALTPGNTLISNIAQSILTPALQSIGF